MDHKIIKKLFLFLRAAFWEERSSEEERIACNSYELSELMVIAKQQDVLHLLAMGMKKSGRLEENNPQLENGIFRAVSRYKKLHGALEQICPVLEDAKIPFIPLKGSVIRRYYPLPWMRTSCDIDILVCADDVEKASSVLVEKCRCQYQGKGSHNASLFTPDGVHVEIHFELIEKQISNEEAGVLRKAWDSAILCKGFSYRYEMSDAMFYFYHIAHMAKHFENGGCGIRPFMDLWILDRIPDVDTKERDQLLEQGGLLKFATAARKLSRVWFAGEEYDSVSRQLETYVLQGGIYGKMENMVTVQQQKHGGRWKYAASKIFISYDVIKFQYPVLQKCPWLLPVMEIRRWGRLLFCGHAKRVLRELEYNKNIPQSTAEDMQNLLKEIGLQ